jgi:hypothetical protein
VHAPDDPAPPGKTEITVLITAKQKKNGRSLWRERDQIGPPRRQCGVHGQDAGMPEKKPIEGGRPPVFMTTDPPPHMFIRAGKIIKSSHPLRLRHGFVAKHCPCPRM